ncbi:EamA family transporter [Sphingobium fuliginis]|uniref:EamA family transporter n=1 Tax=Sphingobium fuliginis (strain ATCC 27551) TaxID=336203 RepID=UPI001FCB23E5|nr:EamA family transporter [Sphingobium fuliginis]
MKIGPEEGHAMEGGGEAMRRFGPLGMVLALLVNLTFALNVIAMKVVVDATAPLLSVALRMGVVFLLCAPAIRSLPGRTGWLALYGFLNGGLFLLLLNIALFMATNVGALAIAGQLSVPFSLLLGALLLGRSSTRARSRGSCWPLPESRRWFSIRTS